MIVGIGTDIVSISRIRQFASDNSKLASVILGEQEYQEYVKLKRDPAYLARRFAAKEAIGKALGVGMLLEAQVLNENSGKPYVVGIDKDVQISLSSDGDYAQAFAIVIGAG
jgi:holo-[acyl-carrier protein] synthase